MKTSGSTWLSMTGKEEIQDLDSSSCSEEDEENEELAALGPSIVACLGFAVFVGLGKLIFAIFARPFCDKDANGKIGHDELPLIWTNWNEHHLGTPQDGGTLFTFGAMTVMQALLEAMVYSYGYGQAMVLICNEILPRCLPDSRGWVICLLLLVSTTFSMCTFVTNTIHIITSHIIHFAYYGFGYLAISTYAVLPSGWLVFLAVLWQLTTHLAMKFYVWPGYAQFPWEVLPLFNYTDGLYTNVTSPLNPSLAGTHIAEMGFPSFLATFYLAFPVHELLNFNIASGMGYGFVIGIISSRVAKLFDQRHNSAENRMAYMLALVGSVFFSLLRIFVGFGFGSIWRTLSRYCPRLLFATSCTASALIMVSATKRTLCQRVCRARASDESSEDELSSDDGSFGKP